MDCCGTKIYIREPVVKTPDFSSIPNTCKNADIISAKHQHVVIFTVTMLLCRYEHLPSSIAAETFGLVTERRLICILQIYVIMRRNFTFLSAGIQIKVEICTSADRVPEISPAWRLYDFIVPAEK